MPTRARSGPTVWDIVPALFVALLVPFITAGIAQSEGAPFGAAGVALVIAMGLTLLAGNRWPAATLLLVSALLTIYLWRGHPYGPVMAAFGVALVGAAVRLPLRRSVPVAALAIAVLASHALAPGAPSVGDAASRGEGPGPGADVPAWVSTGFGIGWAAMIFAVAVALRTRREAQARGRAEHIRSLVDAERLRMSHDVHDGVGHGLAAINLQASLALRSLRRNPDRAEEAMRAIRDSSAAALDELRTVLARMETGDATDARRPTVGLDGVPEVVRRLEQAGMTVTVVGRTDLELPPAVDLTVYRVIQESLTNALRHGTGTEATLRIGQRDGVLTVSVTNPVDRQRDSTGGGRGIPGMYERVTAVGGTLEAGVDGDRFEVRATFPLEEER